jgi:TatD family-associated radical SAM protein
MDGKMKSKPVIAYPLHGALYLNITNRCPNACIFCIRNTSDGVGYNLWLDEEPDEAAIITAIGDSRPYREIVFCGYGEPLLRPEIVLNVAGWLKQQGLRVRVNTNGLAVLFLGYDILPLLAGKIDAISISLNAPDALTYQTVTQSSFGAAAFPALLDFIRHSKEHIPEVMVTAVRYPSVDLKRVAGLAQELGVNLRVREHHQI